MEEFSNNNDPVYQPLEPSKRDSAFVSTERRHSPGVRRSASATPSGHVNTKNDQRGHLSPRGSGDASVVARSKPMIIVNCPKYILKAAIALLLEKSHCVGTRVPNFLPHSTIASICLQIYVNPSTLLCQRSTVHTLRIQYTTDSWGLSSLSLHNCLQNLSNLLNYS